jgi:hypothetical protein
VPLRSRHKIYGDRSDRLIEANGSVIGIDVGCSPARRSSAICRLDWSDSVVAWEIVRFRALEPEREREIARVAGGRRIAVAAFDGPIRRGFDIIGRYRTAERMLTRRLRPLIGKPGQSSAPVGKLLNHHANECVRYLVAHCEVQDAQHCVPIDQRALVEAFPSSFLGMMIENPEQITARRGDRSDTFFQHLATKGVLQALIEHCLPDGPSRWIRAALSTTTTERPSFAQSPLSVSQGPTSWRSAMTTAGLSYLPGNSSNPNSGRC